MKKIIVKIISVIIVVFIVFNIFFIKIGNSVKSRFTDTLKIDNTEIDDLRKINKFPNVKILQINNCRDLSELSFLEQMTDIEDLTLTSYGLYEGESDLSPISNLKKLKVFYSENIAIDDLNYFTDMKDLNFIHIDSGLNNISGIDSLPDTLEILELWHSCSNEKIILNNYPDLKKVMIVISELNELYVDIPSIESLSVSYDKNLKTLIISENCTVLKELKINNCPELNMDSDTILKISSLKKILISEGQFSESEIDALRNNGIEVTIDEKYEFEKEI